MRFTLDTNILVYAADARQDHRNAVSADILYRAAFADCVLALQTLGEFFSVATRGRRVTAADAQTFINTCRKTFPLTAAAEDDLAGAMSVVRDHHLLFWDALLCMTAARAGCKVLLTEDMQDGRRIGELVIVDPFVAHNRTLVETLLLPSR